MAKKVADMNNQELILIAQKIIDEAEKRNCALRLVGSIGAAIHCSRYGSLHRRLGDIDFAALFAQRKQILEILEEFNYRINPEVALYSRNRLVLAHRSSGVHIDVYLDKLEYCHTINFKGRLFVDNPTLPLAELVLSKLQIVECNEKDALDVIALLREHTIGHGDYEEINGDIIAGFCAADWGLWRTAGINLQRIREFASACRLINAKESAIVSGRIRILKDAIDKAPKGLRWRLRNTIGDRVKRFRDVFEVEER